MGIISQLCVRKQIRVFVFIDAHSSLNTHKLGLYVLVHVVLCVVRIPSFMNLLSHI